MERNNRQELFFLIGAKTLVPLFFAAYLFLGLLVYKDYGLSWDEMTNRRNGAISAIYVNAKFNYLFLSRQALEAKLQRIRSEDDTYWGKDVNGPKFNYRDDTLHTYVDRDYGVFFELILTALEALFKLEDSRDVYLMRHLFTFLLFYVGAWFFYLLTADSFNNRLIGLLAASLLILSPRIFADSFYNSKDLAFLSMFIIATYSLIRLLNNPSMPNAAFHALTNAALIDIRITGVLIPAMTFLFIAFDVLKSSLPRTKLKDISPALLLYGFFLPCLTVLFWPYLWESPLHFVQAFRDMSEFRFEGEMLYLGKYVSPTSLPWHYIPVWIAITTPLFYSFCFMVGLYYSAKTLWQNGLKFYSDDAERQDLINLLFFFLPIISVVALKSVLYDGWRHLFFVYPAFLSIGVKGLVSFYESSGAWFGGDLRAPFRGALLGALVLSFATTGYFMVKYHPHQQVHFNLLAGRKVGSKFELDYWGLSYRQGLEHVLRNDASSIIKVNAANFPGKLNAKILEPKERERLRYVSLEDATYFLSDFRYHPQAHAFGLEVYSINVNGAQIIAVYKLR